MAQVVTVFGAGASHGSQLAGGPPLGCDLLQKLAAFEPVQWEWIAREYSDAFREDFEQGFAKVAESEPTRVTDLQKSMARYFHAFRPTPDNLYCELARRIARCAPGWPGALVTLNYEIMLQSALLGAGLICDYADGGRDIKLCVPHGSCYLFCDDVRMNPAVRLHWRVQIDGPRIVALADPNKFARRIKGDAVPPVMSYYMEGKHTPSGASFIAQQRARCKQLLANAEAVVVVGVALRRDDKHIWDPLAETNATVVYCSGERAGKSFQEWAREARKERDSIDLKGYFADRFADILGYLRLDGD